MQPLIPPFRAEQFDVTDTIFNEFKAFIDPTKFEYDKVCGADGAESPQSRRERRLHDRLHSQAD